MAIFLGGTEVSDKNLGLGGAGNFVGGEVGKPFLGKMPKHFGGGGGKISLGCESG